MGRRGPAALLLALAACAPAATRGGAPDRLEGRVSVSGSAPMDRGVSLHPQGGSGVWLAGPLQPELARLAGTQVEVRGRMEGGSMQVDSYRLVSVDGRPALVGVVQAAPGGGLQLLADDGRTVRLGDPPAQLRPGQKVWVQGPGQAQVQVQTFGVIVP
jgi:hypothetical protein